MFQSPWIYLLLPLLLRCAIQKNKQAERKNIFATEMCFEEPRGEVALLAACVSRDTEDPKSAMKYLNL